MDPDDAFIDCVYLDHDTLVVGAGRSQREADIISGLNEFAAEGPDHRRYAWRSREMTATVTAWVECDLALVRYNNGDPILTSDRVRVMEGQRGYTFTPKDSDYYSFVFLPLSEQ
jgi:hypothetical protein